ncbi:MAG: FAD-dependent oxidoreductase [Oscillospiraceae bacterium]|nr:FAD-dependent oxidoreductase [Oscillospiraceae bacterium]
MLYDVKGKIVLEPQRELPVIDEADVVVAGGGAAGFAAAIASARAGARTLLVEDRSSLGGVATAVMMNALVASHSSQGIALEIMDRMAAMGGAPKWAPAARKNGTTPFDVECFKEAALAMCIEAGVKIYFYTRACALITVDAGANRGVNTGGVAGEDGNRSVAAGATGAGGNRPVAAGVVVESKAGRGAILAKVVIDCTGDADLAAGAGAPVSKGREGDHKMRPFALLFQMGGLDIEKIAAYTRDHPDQLQPQHTHDTRHRTGGDTVEDGVRGVGGEEVITRISGFYDLVEQAKATGDLYEGIHYFRLETLWVGRGTATCNTTRIYNVDGTDPADLTRGEIEGRGQIKRLLAFARKYIPGCENAYLINIAPAMGVRETRRILGEYFLTTEDAYADKHFDDAIMTLKTGLPPIELIKELDVHMPEPIEGSDRDLLEKHPDKMPREPHEYQIPYRALIPRGVGGLLVAGKTISVSHLIDGYTRNMIPCMCFGQIAGTAAAMCAQGGQKPAELSCTALKAELLNQGYDKF